jgi:hypothetical protein
MDQDGASKLQRPLDAERSVAKAHVKSQSGSGASPNGSILFAGNV